MFDLIKLLEEIEYEGTVSGGEVADIVIDSRRVQKGSLFVCIKGARFDGHDKAAEALEKGAVAVVTERKLGLSNEAVVADTRKANALLSAAFFNHPERTLKLVAVTGTNGKTTVATLIKQGLAALGKKAGLIGTIEVENGEMTVPAKFTTPEPFDLYALLSAMTAAGCEYAVMEASSQALAQHRLYGLHFASAVFTNLTEDHLDYHHTMEAYFEAKRSLFDMAGHAVVNIDDEYGRRLRDTLAIPATTFSESSNDADFTAKSVDESIAGVRFAVSGDGFICRVKLPMPGHYTVLNALAAVSALMALGFSGEDVCTAVSESAGVRGRCEIIHSDGELTVIRDFAHTEDALRQLLSAVRPHAKKRLVVLFGCAGDRDAKKRPGMANAVAEYADFAVVSSDNPRTEDPDKIIREVTDVLDERRFAYRAEPERERAINWALANREEGDILLLCGKGHEDYQVLDGVTVYLDEREVVERYFRRFDETI